MVLGAFHVPEAWQDQAAIAFRLSLACFAVSTVGGVLQAALTGLQRLDLTGGIGVLLSPVLVFLVAFGLRMPSPIVAVLGAQLIHATLTCALLGGACWAVFRQGAARAGNVPSAGEPPLREMVGYGLRVQVGALASFLHMQLDKVLIGAWAGLIWVAPCELGLRVVNGVVSAPQLFLGALLPALADLDARGGRERSELYRAIFEPYVLVVVPLCVGTATLAAPLFQAWLGATRSDASLALRLLMAAAGPALVASVATTLLRAMGRPGLEARYAFLALVMHALLAVVGMRWWGWMGVLVGGALSSALAAAWLVTAAERWLGLVPWRVSLPVLVRATIAAAVAAAATTGLIQLPHLPSGRAAGFAFLAAGGAVFTVAYAVTLVIVAPRSARGLWERLRAAWPG
jgi:O-antigen/teichoic acid export membrane protein